MPDKRKNRVFKLERKDIQFPIWRKKVDGSIFNERAITIPNSFLVFWNIPARYKGVAGRDQKSKIQIHFEGQSFEGYVTELQAKKRRDSYRIFYGNDLCDLLKDKYAMTFMRDLEFKLGDYANDQQRANIEDVIPFWEFLDIEFDTKDPNVYFTCHYRQRPEFSYLFKKIVDSTILRGIELELEGKHDKRIQTSKWYKKADLNSHLDAVNVIYFLLDQPNKRIYVGEAKSLKSRLGGNRPEIPDWTHFRYEVLPALLEPFRLEIERMIISSFMHLFSCDVFKGSPMVISDHMLMNRK